MKEMKESSMAYSGNTLKFEVHQGPHPLAKDAADGAFSCDHEGVHYHVEEWELYWRVLNLHQQRWLSEKAQWEEVPIAQVASEHGAPIAERRG